ncbi:MAG: YceI family protein [Spirochaetaceae bacterium]
MVKRPRTAGILLIVFTALVFAASALTGFLWVDGGPAEPTRPVDAPPVEEPLVDDHETEFVVYRLVPQESTASFVVDEILRGEPNTVTGITDQLDGSVLLSFESGAIVIAPFEINLRTLRTDDELRDRTIRSRILQSSRDEYEFSVFSPQEVTGMPDSLAVGDQLELQVSGDLQIRDVIREVVFAMEILIESQDRIHITATTDVSWNDFDITVPYVGGDSIVSAVSDTVELRLDIVATTGG